LIDWKIKPSKTFSQGGQDGIVESIFLAIGTTNKFCVEFGFNSDSLLGGSGSNTARLILQDKWTGLLLDSDNENLEINLHRARLTYENIGLLFENYGVPSQPDYVSIDVDGDDLWLFKGMLEACYRPRLVSVEYNARFPIDVSATMRNAPRWENDAAYGASMLALCIGAQEFGYGLVAVEGGLDLFLVRGAESNLSQFVQFTNIHVHPVPTLERQKLFVTYPELEPVTHHPWWSG
jgi:hypothetical protein